MKPAIAPLNRILRDVFRVEPLEARVLLSADPVLGAAQIVLRPPEQDAAALVAQAYTAPADGNVAGPTVLADDGASQQAMQSQWLEVDAGQLSDGNGEVVVDGAMRMSGMAVQTLAAVPTDTDANDIFVPGDLIVDTFRWLQAGTDGTGSIQLGSLASHKVNGNGDATDDFLVLSAPDNVRILGKVGDVDPLEGLDISGVNIDFGNTVTINGNLTIAATGTVTFTGKVMLLNGGSLSILGAQKVVFAAGLELQGTGDIVIEANEIDFTGGGSDAIKGQGLLELRPTNVAFGIDIGSLPASPLQPTPTTLNLDTSELKLLADGFSRIVIGVSDGTHADAGAGSVRIGAMDSLDSPIVRDALEVYGGSISVEDLGNPDYIMQVVGTIKLDAVRDINIANRLEAIVAPLLYTDIELYSQTGRIQQLDASGDLRTSEPLRAAALTLHAATGISLPFTEVTSVSAVNTGSGDLTITETAAGGDVAITLLSQQATSAGINLKTTAGSISVGGTGINNAGSGATELQAAGSLKAITVNQAINSSTGLVRLTATGAITTVDDAVNNGTIATGGAAAIELLSTAGAISQGGNITSAGGAVSLDAFTFLTMVDGVHATSVNGAAGSVALRARGGDVTVSVVEAGGSMAITASGAIIDGLTGANPNLDGDAAAVLLAAASGIGASATPLQTKVGTLAATNTATGGVFVREATALRLAGGTAGLAIDARGSTGNVAIVTVNGSLTVGQALGSTGSVGHMLLQSGETGEGTAAGLIVQANISLASGSLSLLSADGIVVDDLGVGASTISVASATQTIDVEAADGIAMEALARFTTAGGAARLRANGGDIALGIVNVGAGSATLSASGSIVDMQPDDATPTANVVAGSARLQAGAGLGAGDALVETQVATLAASAGGALFLAEIDNVSVGSVAAVSVNRIDAQGTVASNPADAGALAGVTSGAALVLRSGGNLSVDQAISGAGHLLVASTGTMNITTTVGTTGGNVSAIAGGTLTMTAAGVVSSTVGSIELQSTGGAIAMANGAMVLTNSQAIRAQAAGDVTVGLLDARSAADRAGNTLADAATWGTASVVAGGAIVDNAGETATDLYGRAVRLQAASGIASAAEKLEIEAGQLSATAGSAGLFLTEATSVDLAPLAAIVAQRVGIDGTSAAGPTDAAQAGLASGGALVLQALAGSITSTGTATVGAAGNLLLDAQGGASSIDLGAAASSSGGSISLQAAQDVLLNASVSTTAVGKSIDVRAGRDVTQAQGTSLSANNGNIALEATTGSVTLETTTAGTGGVWISATNIIDGDAAGDTEVDIGAASAQLLATGAIGAAGANLETQVATLTASAGAGLFLTESDGLAVDRLQLDVDRIGADGNATATAHAAQEDLSAATVVLTALAGDLTFNAGTGGTAAVNGGSGNVRLEAAAGRIDVNAAVNAGSGNASVLASAGIGFAAAGNILTTAGTLDLETTAGDITMADGALAQTGGGAIRLKAAGSITVGRLDAGAGSVSVLASNAIADNVGETNVDIVAGALRLQAGAGGIGSGTDALETEVAQLSATAGAGGLFLAEATGVTVTQTAAVSVNRVGADGATLAAQTDAAQSGLTSGGVLVLQTTSGTVTTTAQGAIAAAGNMLVRAGGATSDLDIGAAVTSSGGSIHVIAGQDALLHASLSTATTARSVVVEAGRHITQDQGTAISTVNGGIDLEAGAAGTITLETLTAGSAGVQASGGAIVDGDAAGDTEVDIVANRASLSSATGIGAAGAQLETTVDTLRAAAVGALFINETDALVLDNVSVGLQRIDAAGAATDVNTSAVAGLAGGNVVLLTLNGSVSSTAAAAVAASGNLLLQATGAAADLTLAGTTSAAGALSLSAGHDVTLKSSVTTTTAGSTIDVLAQGRIDAQQGSAIVASNASVQLVAAGGSVTLESVNAGTGNVRISGTSISDGDAASDTEVDIVADGLLLTANSAGTGANPLETSVNTLTVAASGLVGIVDSDGLVLGAVTASVNRVGIDGTTAATAPVTQSNVTGSTVTLRTLDGPLVASASGAVTVTGNVLLKAAGATGDVTLSAAVSSSGGNISVDAARNLTQGANITTTLANNTVDLLAGGNLEQLQGAALSTVNGHASLAAAGTVTVETITAGTGRVNLSGASVVDGDTAGDTEVDVTAQQLRVTATAGAIGSSANNLESTISTLSAVATGDVFVTESDALDLAVVSVTVNRVANNGGPAAVAILGQNNVAGATIVVRTLAGNLTSQTTGAVVATGNVLLQAGGATSDMTLAGTVTSSGGHVSLAAGQDMSVGASVSATGSGKSVDFVAGRNFAQAQSTLVTSANGNIALQAGGSATIETFNAGTGQLRIAAASVADGDPAGDTEVDLIASAAQIVTTGAVGGPANALETLLQTLAAATGNLYLTESDALTLGALAVDTQRVDATGAATATANAATSGVTAGITVIQAKAGSLDSLAGIAVSASGNLLLKAIGASSDLVLRGAVTGGGFATLDAGRDLVTQGAVTLTLAGRGLVLQAGRDFAQAEGSSASTSSGAITLTAVGNALVDTLAAGAGTVRIAAVNVVDVDADGDTEVDVTASGLQVAAGGAVGTAVNALETGAATLTLQAGGAAFLTESDALQLTTVSIGTERVGVDGAVQAVVNTSQANVTAGGALVVRTVAGTLTSAAGTGVVSAAGNLLLAAGGATSNLGLNAAVSSSGGNVSLAAGQDLVLGANVSTAASGATIDLLAGRDAVQAQGTSIASTDGNIALEAAGSATLETLAAGSAGVWVGAAAIVDGDGGGDAEVDIAAGAAQLRATGAIGAGLLSALETSVDTLAAQSGGDLFITESNGLTVGSVLIDVTRVGADAVGSATAHAALAGLGGASTVLRTVDGALAVQEAVAATGNLLLRAGGAAGDLAIDAGTTAGGALSLDAARDLAIGAAVATTGAGSTIDLLAQGTITAGEGSSIAANNANVLIAAGGDVTLESVAAGTGSVRITGANLVDGDADGDAESDIAAAQLQVTVTGSVGSLGNALETTVGTLSVAAGGTIVVLDSDALVVDAVAFGGIDRVGSDDGGTANFGFAAQADVRSTGGVVALGGSGDVTLAALAQVASTGGDVFLYAGGALALGAQAGVSSSGAASLGAANGISMATLAAVVAADDVMLTTPGAVSLADQTRITSATGNVLVDADGAVSLGASAAVSTATGNVTIDAQGDVSLATQASIAAIGFVSVTTPGALTLADHTSVTGINGAILLDADGALDIGASANIHTDNGAVTLDAGAALTVGADTTIGTGSGNIALTAGAALSLGANVAVDTDGGTAAFTAQGDLSLGTAASVEATGAISLTSHAALSMADESTVTSSAGAVTLDAATTLTMGADTSVATGSGAVQLLSGAALLVGNDGNVSSGSGDVTLDAGGTLTLDAGASVIATTGTATLDAEGDLALGTAANVDASGVISLATRGAISLADQATVSSSGDQVTLDAATSLTMGADTSVATGSGPVKLLSGTALFVGNDGNVSSDDGNVTLDAGGALTLAADADVIAAGGTATLDAEGNLSMGMAAHVHATGAIDLTTRAAIALDDQATVSSTGGAVTLDAATSLALGADTAVTTGSGPVDLQAGAALSVGNNGVVRSDNGTATLDALGALSLGNAAGVSATGAASLTSAGSLSTGSDATITSTGSNATLASSQANVALGAGTHVAGQTGTTLTALTDISLGLAAEVASATGAATLTAQGAMTLADQARVTAAAAANLSAVGNLGAGNDVVISSTNSSASLASSQGTLTLGDRTSVTSAGAASLSADGNLATGSNTSVTSSGSTASLVSTTGDVTLGISNTVNGQAGATLAAQGNMDLGASTQVVSGAGAAGLTAQGTLALGNLVTVSSAGAASLSSVGSLGTGSNVTITSTGSSATLASSQADVALGAGTHVAGQTGATLTAQTDISLGVAAEVASAAGAATLTAQGAMTLADQARVTAAAAVSLSAQGSLATGTSVSVSSGGSTVSLASVAGAVTVGSSNTVAGQAGATLSAQGNMTVGASTQVTSAGGAATLGAQGTLALGDMVGISAAGNVVVESTGALTTGTDVAIASTGNGTVVRSTSGAISVGDSSSITGLGMVSVSALGNLTLGASTEVTSSNDTVSLATQADLAVGTQAVVSGHGNTSLTSTGDLALAGAAAVSSSAGNVVLDAQGDLALASAATVTAAGSATLGADGTLALAADVRVAAAGAVALASGGATTLATRAEVASTGSTLTLVSGGTLALDAAAALRAVDNVAVSAQGSIVLADQATVQATGAATIDVTSATGSVLMDPDTSTLQTGSGDIRVTAEGDIRPGAIVTSGQAFLHSRNGRILIAGDLQRNGEDVDLFGDDLVITVPVSSPGGTLNIGPVNPGTTVLIGDSAPGGSTLQVDTGELALLQDGFAQIVIGSALANTTLTLDGVTSALVFNDPLLLTATGAGGTVAVNGSLSGDSLTIADAGAGSTLRNATISMQGSVLVQDQLVIDGPTAIDAGTSGSGNLQFTQTVTGQGGAADTLALSAQGGNVQFDAAVSGLDGLTISGAGDVRFGAGLSLDGDLVIDATGTVTFAGPITLNNGARLIIRGTANVVFASSADFGTGDVTVQTAAIAASGGAGSLRGTGLFAVQGTAAAMPVYVGSGAPAGALQVGDDVLRAIGSGFDALRIGSGASAVTIADSDFSLTGAPVQVEGSSIAIATSGAGMLYATEVNLHATGAITTSGQVVATTAAALHLRSDGAGITMAAGSLLRSLGGDVTLDAVANLAVAGIDARSGGGTGGLVTLHTSGGLVVDANGDSGVDVYARGVTLSGLGPLLGGGDVLEVAATLVRVDTPQGVVVRETGTDGRSYFNVVNGAELRQALVAVGGASRVTSDLDTFIAGGGQQSLAAVSPPSSALQSLLAASPSALADLNGTVQIYLASSAMPATDPGLTLAERLQAESELSFASGQPVASEVGVDFWSESLSL